MCDLRIKLCPLPRAQFCLFLNRRLVVFRSANHRLIEARSYFFLEAFFFAFFFAAMLDLHVGVNPRSSIYTVDGNASKGYAHRASRRRIACVATTLSVVIHARVGE